MGNAACNEGRLRHMTTTQQHSWQNQFTGISRLDADLAALDSRAYPPNPSLGPPQRLEFEYDAQGRRIGKKVWDNPAGTGTPVQQQRFVYDGWNLIAILDSQSSILQSFVWGLDLSGSLQGAGGVGGLLWLNDAAHGTHFCAYDGNGNVVALTSAADGTESGRYEYGPFGEPIRGEGTVAEANPFRFSTKFTDDETDLLYYGYRFYNPSTGRWPNRDPIGEKGGRNLYGFVYNNPVGLVDGDGRVHIVIPPVVIAIGVGLGYCADVAGCRLHVNNELCKAARDANRVAPDGSEHHTDAFLCRNTYRDVTPREGDHADLLTHCIAACRLAQRPFPCLGPDGALAELQRRESRESAGSEIDWRNNNVGSGVGINIGPKGDCVQGCLDALGAGLLYTIANGRPESAPAP
jgi:RHS repeat-associated protein